MPERKKRETPPTIDNDVAAGDQNTKKRKRGSSESSSPYTVAKRDVHDRPTRSVLEGNRREEREEANPRCWEAQRGKLGSARKMPPWKKKIGSNGERKPTGRNSERRRKLQKSKAVLLRKKKRRLEST